MDFHKWDNIGGLPLEQDDFLFEQTAIRKTFLGLLSMIESGDDQGYILSGCERTVGAGVINFAAGWFVLNGEIYEVTAHSVPDNGNTEYWEIFEQADPAGDEQFEDTVTRSTYIQRRARVAESATPPGTFTPALAPSVFDKLRETDALAIDDLEQEVDVNTADIAEIEGTWVTYNVVNGDLERSGSSDDLTAVSGYIRFKVVGKTLHYNMNFGGTMPANSTGGFDFEGAASKLSTAFGSTIAFGSGSQETHSFINEAAGAETHQCLVRWSSATGLNIIVIGGTTLNSGNAVTVAASGSIELA